MVTVHSTKKCGYRFNTNFLSLRKLRFLQILVVKSNHSFHKHVIHSATWYCLGSYFLSSAFFSRAATLSMSKETKFSIFLMLWAIPASALVVRWPQSSLTGSSSGIGISFVGCPWQCPDAPWLHPSCQLRHATMLISVMTAVTSAMMHGFWSSYD